MLMTQSHLLLVCRIQIYSLMFRYHMNDFAAKLSNDKACGHAKHLPSYIQRSAPR